MLLALLLLLQDRGSAWTRHTIDASSRGADGTRLGDANGDGLPDIVTGWEEGGQIRLALNPGTSKARGPWPTVKVGEVGSPEDALLMDVDGDGAMDVVSCCEGKTRAVSVHWAPEWRTSTFPAVKDRCLWMFAAPLGRDLIVGGKGPGAEIGRLVAPAAPRQVADWRYETLSPCGWVMTILPRDMDGDGDLDVLLSDRKGELRGVRWLENPGWKNHFLGGRDREVMFLTVAGEDLFCAVKDGPILRARGKELFDIPMPANCGSGKSVASGDLDLDGEPDLVVSCEHASGPKSGVVALLRRKDAWEPREISGPAGTKFDMAVLLDLDGDGDLDVLTCEEIENLGVIWYENPAR